MSVFLQAGANWIGWVFAAIAVTMIVSYFCYAAWLLAGVEHPAITTMARACAEGMNDMAPSMDFPMPDDPHYPDVEHAEEWTSEEIDDYLETIEVEESKPSVSQEQRVIEQYARGEIEDHELEERAELALRMDAAFGDGEDDSQ